MSAAAVRSLATACWYLPSSIRRWPWRKALGPEGVQPASSASNPRSVATPRQRDVVCSRLPVKPLAAPFLMVSIGEGGIIGALKCQEMHHLQRGKAAF